MGATIGSSATQPTPQPQPALSPPPAPPLVPMLPPAPQPSHAQAPVPDPSGDCVSSGAEYYTMACAALATSCEQYSFCKRVSGSTTPSTAPPSGACVSNDP